MHLKFPRRLGLSEHVISLARSYVSEDSQQVENMIASLEDSKRQAEKDLQEANEVFEECRKTATRFTKENDGIL